MLTKWTPLKYKVKLWLKLNLNDNNEILWSYMISMIYTLIPVTIWLFNINYLKIEVKWESILFFGVLGFFMSIALSNVLFRIYYKYFWVKSEFTDTTWMKQSKKIAPAIIVGAAIGEELAFRLLLPIFTISLFGGGPVVVTSCFIMWSVVFVTLQVYYCDTKIQKDTLALSSISISISTLTMFLIAGLTYGVLIAHVIYVIFYLNIFIKKEGE